jgi:putative membrane protein (TIGR04086 family)
VKSKIARLNKKAVYDVFRGLLISVIVCLISVLLLSIIVKFVGLSDKVVLPIVQVLKLISILVGCLFGIKEGRRGSLKGGLVGLLFTSVSVFVFLILGGSLKSYGLGFVDFLAGIVAGIVSGIICVSFKKP